jgi:uncharacterized protein YecE (DUF72 family)
VIEVGCCGFQKAHTTYFENYRLIEIQRTFYKLPQVATARRWRHEEAPPGFTFTLKAWQLITHSPNSPTYSKARLYIPGEARERYGYFRPTPEVFEAWERTREVATTLQAPIALFQCPASFTPTDEHKENMRAFFSGVERDGLIFAWEPRGEWTDEEIGELCAELDLVHCVDPFERQPVTTGLAYLRLHGIGGYDYRYSDAELAQVAEWIQPFETVYLLFNNVWMWEDGLRFREMFLGGSDGAAQQRGDERRQV